MNQYFRYFGIMDKLKLKRLDDEAFDTIYYKGKTYNDAGGFEPFYQWLNQPFGEYHYTAQEDDLSGKLLNEWQTSADSITMLISQIRISDQNKETVYQHFSKDQDVVIFDRSYFANKWVSAINDDFYLILYISSFLIFFTI
jgi:uncharacterized protein